MIKRTHSLLFITYFNFFIGLSLMHAQNQSRLDTAIATLQQYANRIPSTLGKIIDCARGKSSCTQEEITQARVMIGAISAALIVTATAITGGVVAKRRGWWPFGKKASAIEPIPMPETPKVTQKEAADAADALKAIYIQPKFIIKEKSTEIQDAINTIDTALDQQILNFNMLDIAQEKSFSLRQIIQGLINELGDLEINITSRYIQPTKKR